MLVPHIICSMFQKMCVLKVFLLEIFCSLMCHYVVRTNAVHSSRKGLHWS